MATIHVSKLDAAKRQLETAIRIYLRGGDPVSTHTLAAAAFDLLRDVASKQGIQSFLKDNIFIRPEKKAEVLAIINKDQNFFKHADQDHDAIREFDPERTLFFLWDAGNLYQHLTGELTPTMLMARAWFYITHRTIVIDTEWGKQIDEFAKRAGITDKSKLVAYESYFQETHDSMFQSPSKAVGGIN